MIVVIAYKLYCNYSEIFCTILTVNHMEYVTALKAPNTYILQNLEYINLTHNLILSIDYIQNIYFKSLKVCSSCVFFSWQRAAHGSHHSSHSLLA